MGGVSPMRPPAESVTAATTSTEIGTGPDVARPAGRAAAMAPRPPGTLKAATRALVDQVGGLERAAELVGRGPSYVHQWTDPSRPDRTIPAAAVTALEARAAHPAVTAWLAAEAGCALLPLVVRVLEPGDAVAALSRVAGRAAHLFEDEHLALASRRSPGRIDAQEAGSLIDDVDVLMAALAEARGALVRLRDGGGP